MNKLTHHFLMFLIVQNQQFLNFHLSLKEYFQVLNLYKLSYYDVNMTGLNIFIENIVLLMIHLKF